MKLKMIAIAAAVLTMAGTAQAALTSGTTQNNGSFSLVAWNDVTRAWYIRDLGYLMNDFLPSTVTTAAADGGVTGNKTPDAGELINASNKSNFADNGFSTWLAANSSSGQIRWMVGAYDQVSSSGTGSQRRMIVSSSDANDSFLNSALDTFVGTSQYGGLFNYFGTSNPAVSASATSGMQTTADTGFQSGANYSLVGDSASLYYVTRTGFTGSTGSTANGTKYGNSANFATITLEADGDLIYSLAPAAAVPLPPALWLMGAGMLAMGGMVRRRRAAAQA